jgi:chromatin structure-remodeling complex subunit RSC1/2
MAPSQASSTPDPKSFKAENDDKPVIKPGPSNVTEPEYEAMQTLLTDLYNYRTKDDEDPSRVFHRKVNKRMVPDYYDVIKEPMAMSMIKSKINTKDYKSFEEFVRDWALICHNAQVYNAPAAQAFKDALIIKSVVQQELVKIAEKGIVTKERIELPYLGEVPEAEEILIEEVEEEEEEEEDDEDDEEDSEDEGKKKKKRGRPSLASKREREERGEKDDEPDTRKKRGRPPRVDTPMESRIKAIMKGLRKPKNATGDLMILSFERLPDKAALPDYFREIKNPIAFDVIKKKLKRKKYTTIDQFTRDLDLMFENAKQYNQDASEIYKDAVALQKEAHELAEIEKAKPDTDFVMEDGRIPLTNGILHNGELWKVGKY